MKINKISIKNFLSIAEDVSLDLDNQGLVGVFGRNNDSQTSNSNGCGKSAIWDALVWCLYGKTLRGISGDDVVNRFIGGGTEVAVEFTYNNTECSIVRHRKHKLHKNEVYIYMDGSTLSQATATRTQELIDSILGYDYQTFKVVVLFSQDTFRFASATDREQKAIFDQILGLDQYETALQGTRKRLEAVRKKIADYNRAIPIYQSQQEEAGKSLVMIDEKIKNNQFVIEKRKNELEFQMTEAIQRADAAESHHILAKAEYEKMSEAWNKRESVMRTASMIKDKINLLTANLTYSNRAEEDQKKIMKLCIGDLEKLKDGPSCFACGQAIDKAQHDAQIDKALSALAATENTTKTILEERKKFTEQLEKNESELKVLAMHSDLKATDPAEKGRGVAKLEQEIQYNIGRAETLKQSLEQLDKEKNTSFEELRENAQNQLKNCAEKIKVSSEQCSKEKELEATYMFWEQGFGPAGLRSYILDSITPYLNERANYYAQELLDGTVRINFSTQSTLASGDKRDKFSITVENERGAGEYAGNSLGEKQRIDVCIGLALHDLAASRTSKPINLAIFDETFEHMDAIGCDRVMALLRKLMKNYGSIFVTTHLDSLQEQFHKKIIIVKENKQSKLV